MSLHERAAALEEDVPEWQGPPRRMLPGVAPTERVLVDTGEVVIALGAMLAYPTGATIALEISDRRAPAGDAVARELLDGTEGSLRLDVSYEDGRCAGGGPPQEQRPEPGVPVLAVQRADGLACDQTIEYWLWPLPPPGAMTIAVAWRRRGVPRSTTRVDGALVRSASERSRRF